MGFTLDDLTPKRPATAVTPVTNFPDDNAVKPEVAVSVQTTDTEPGKGTAIDTTGITKNGGKESFALQPTEEVTKVEPNQGIKIDWSRPYSEIEQNPLLRQMKPYDIMRDYQKNGDGNWSAFMPWLSSLGDADKTVAANAALQKKAENQAKWEQWGNLFMHLGNFFGTVQGAPSQKIESAQELTDRQRKIRDATEALRAKGYNQMMVNIYKDRQDKQSQMQAEAAAKANEELAAYRGSQKNQTDALTPVKVQTEKERGNAAAAQAALSTSKKETEDALRGKKGKLLDAQTNNANAGAADHNASVNVKGAQVRHINSQTEGQNQRNANQKEADDFNTRYVNDPVFKKHVNEWAKNNGMAIGGNDGRGGTWANEKNRQQASRWAKAKMKLDRTPPSRRGRGGSKVPPSRRGGSKVPPSRRTK
ncbi:hypothetical protein DWV76_06190 [Segatella copri]|uniref:Uncharacterized protein n=1 Tax=Segatella copri TaxID=165179 RepID=A0AA92TZY1_9BACT|nr:hypothetical protein [Segatella copri]RGW43290.1 hypothetical protein DWV76_06190 [Segatella copri]